MENTDFFSLSEAHAVRPTLRGGVEVYKKFVLPGVHSVSVVHRGWFADSMSDEVYFASQEQSYGITFNRKALACIGTVLNAQPVESSNLKKSLVAAGFARHGNFVWTHPRVKTLVVWMERDGNVTVLRRLFCKLLPKFDAPLVAILSLQKQGRPCHSLHMSMDNGTRMNVTLSDEPLQHNVEGVVAAGYENRPLPLLPPGWRASRSVQEEYSFD